MKRASNYSCGRRPSAGRLDYLVVGGFAFLVGACGGKFESSGSGGQSSGGAAGSGAKAGSAGSSGTAGGGGVAGSAGVGGGTGGTGAGGTSGGAGCTQGGACAPEGATCTDHDCCPCLYECKGGRWQMTACAGCVGPTCPPTVPRNGESCDACQHPVGTPCHYDQCPTVSFQATCDGMKWSVTTLPCMTPGCCSADGQCGPGQICVSTICKTPSPDRCWRDAQCGPGSFCSGASICGCAADCAFPDQAGSCVPNGFGCCRSAPDCGMAGQQCVAGMCKTPAPVGRCWTDRDCTLGRRCQGQQICPCGTACALPDVLGTCS